jgi:hypothetical protein
MPNKIKKIKGEHLAKLVGTTSYLKIVWKDWTRELPLNGDKIYVTIRLDNGYYSVSAKYFEQPIPYGCDHNGKMVIPPRVFRFVRFENTDFPDIHIGTKDARRLISWGKLEMCK